MKYRDPETGEFKELYNKAADTLPVGTVVDFDGDEVPAGWEEDEATDNYSTEETFTGKYWIDGKKIYRKVINHGELGGDIGMEERTFTYPGHIERITESHQTMVSDKGYSKVVPFKSGDNMFIDRDITSNADGSLEIKIFRSNVTQFHNWILQTTIEYTKTTD